MTTYDPVKDGLEKKGRSVTYAEAKPPDDLSRLVHCFWELKTDAALADDFFLHVLPDACVNILFNVADTRIAAITALQITHEVLNLGKTFHYTGVQLLPGVWQGNRDEIFDTFVDTPYSGSLPLSETSGNLSASDFPANQLVLAELVRRLVHEKQIVANTVIEKILASIPGIRTVAEMAVLAGISPRHLQRETRRATGLAPHDLLKILRLQHSFKGHYRDLYADQSHFIHSFRKITGYTPGTYDKKFDV